MGTVGIQLKLACSTLSLCTIGMAALTVILGAAGLGFAEQAQEAVDEVAEQAEAANRLLGDRRFFVMPVPIYNPTIGTGLGAISMYLFQAGENAPPSTFMLGGFWADSRSWAGGAGAKIHTRDDTYRLSGWIGYFDANLKFYGIGGGAGDREQPITTNQYGPFFASRALRRVTEDFYIGLGFRHMTVTTRFADLPEWIPGDILRDGIKLRSSGLGLVAEYDSRDNAFNPFSGGYLQLTTNFAREALGSDRNYEQYDASYNWYAKVGKDRVLAWRVTGCSTGGDAPFYDICLFGGSKDGIRGYVGGQYRDKASLTTQLEYRWKFYRKWGMVVFAGVGQIGPSLGDMSTDHLLPSYGAGIRFMASDEQRINLGIDYARGKDSSAWYFRIVEAF